MKIVSVPKGVRIAVIGDIHEHSEQFFKMLELLKPSENMWIASVGDVWDKGFGTNEADKITNELMRLSKNNIGFAVVGNHEKKQIRKAKKDLSPQLKWWKAQPLCTSFEFSSGSKLTILHGGVTPKHRWEDLYSDVEICYIREIDTEGKMIPLVWKNIEGVQTLLKSRDGGCSWHEVYDGRFGYIASGHAAQKDGKAKFYNYSCNLDSAVFETGVLTAQIFDSDGRLLEAVTVNGTPARPNI